MNPITTRQFTQKLHDLDSQCQALLSQTLTDNDSYPAADHVVSGYLKAIQALTIAAVQQIRTTRNETPKPQTKQYPVIYELDNQGEATGIVHFYCCKACQNHVSGDFDVTISLGQSESPDNQTQCENPECGMFLIY